MKFLLLLLVVGIALWAFKARNRVGGGAAPRTPPAPKVQPMLACAHCGVHLPQADALMDPAGRPYCTDAHRLAGPR